MADTAVAGRRVSGPGRPASGERLRPRRPGARRETLAAYGFIAPNYLLLLVFVLVPLVGAFLVSLQRTDGFGAGTFAGLDAEGALVICDAHGQRRTVTFGDVSLVAAAPREAG